MNDWQTFVSLMFIYIAVGVIIGRVGFWFGFWKDDADVLVIIIWPIVLMFSLALSPILIIVFLTTLNNLNDDKPITKIQADDLCPYCHKPKLECGCGYTESKTNYK